MLKLFKEKGIALKILDYLNEEENRLIKYVSKPINR